MQANYVQRLRLTFSKGGPARYISHLDLARAFERSFRRAGILVAFTQGFNRRPRLTFAAALPLGYTSEYELADVWLLEEMSPETAVEQMMGKMAPGIVVKEAAPVPLNSPSLQSLTLSAGYVVTFLDAVDAGALLARVEWLLAQESVIRERESQKGGTKQYDLRPLIAALAVDSDWARNASLRMTLLLMSGKSGRPDEVLAALALDCLAARVQRTMITLRELDYGT